MTASNQRLQSLDVLRGLDMLLLTVVGPFFFAYNKAFHLSPEFMRQFGHAWGGFTLWDIIMPLFIFISGAAVPFAMDRRKKNGKARWGYWWHVLVRIVFLWILGMATQGRLLQMISLKINPFNNTLQAIACAYLVCAAVYLIRWRWARAAIPVILAAGYAIWLHTGGDYSMNGNAAIRFDRWVLPFVTPEKSKALVLADPGYTWWATIPMFAAMGLCGMEAALILRSAWSPLRRTLTLAVVGGVLMGVGWAFVPLIPPIKHIYTLTFTAQAMGWSCLSLALLYFLIDFLGGGAAWLKWVLWLPTLFGQTALLAYVCAETFGPVLEAWGNMFGPGFAHLWGPWAGTMGKWLAGTLLLVWLLAIRRQGKFRPRTPARDGTDAAPAARRGAVATAVLGACAWTWKWIWKGLAQLWALLKRLWGKLAQAWKDRMPPETECGEGGGPEPTAPGLRGACLRAWRKVRRWFFPFGVFAKELWGWTVRTWKNRPTPGAAWSAFRGACTRAWHWAVKGVAQLGTSIKNLWLGWLRKRHARRP